MHGGGISPGYSISGVQYGFYLTEAFEVREYRRKFYCHYDLERDSGNCGRRRLTWHAVGLVRRFSGDYVNNFGTCWLALGTLSRLRSRLPTPLHVHHRLATGSDNFILRRDGMSPGRHLGVRDFSRASGMALLGRLPSQRKTWCSNRTAFSRFTSPETAFRHCRTTPARSASTGPSGTRRT